MRYLSFETTPFPFSPFRLLLTSVLRFCARVDTVLSRSGSLWPIFSRNCYEKRVWMIMKINDILVVVLGCISYLIRHRFLLVFYCEFSLLFRTCLQFLDWDCHEVFQARDRGDSLLDQVKLFALEIVRPLIWPFRDDHVVLLADRDHFLLILRQLFLNQFCFTGCLEINHLVVTRWVEWGSCHPDRTSASVPLTSFLSISACARHFVISRMSVAILSIIRGFCLLIWFEFYYGLLLVARCCVLEPSYVRNGVWLKGVWRHHNSLALGMGSFAVCQRISHTLGALLLPKR